MTVYFYHTQNLDYIQSEWEQGRFPSHLLYGASQLPQFGVNVIMHKFTTYDKPRWWRCIDVALKVLFCKEKYDAVYATKQNGLDFIILLRALGFFRKPIFLWVHQPVLKKSSLIKHNFAKFYFSGVDHVFQFSDNILQTTIKSGIIPVSKLSVCPWGADLRLYDELTLNNPVSEHSGFISTGKEKRDMHTLVEAFRITGAKLDLITTPTCGNENYAEYFMDLEPVGNVSVLVNSTMWIPELAHKIWPHFCVCICCLETNYSVGLTTLVEALAFGLPVIVSRNPNFPFDVEKENCGIGVDYGDVDGWCYAINWMESHVKEAMEMGRNGRKLAEHIFNINRCASEVSSVLLQINDA